MTANTTDSTPVTAGEQAELRRALGPFHLTALGIGAIIGAGIFVITGHAAQEYAGPGIMISFIIAGVGCAFAGLCYAEFASMIPVAGSAYTYTYATLGRFMAWVIGWDLILEYLAAGGAVSSGWSSYFVAMMKNIGVTIPAEFAHAPLDIGAGGAVVATGAILNVPAVVLIAFVTTLLVIGVRQSATFNGIMVLIKLSIVLLVIIFGLPLIKPENLQPFIPPHTEGWHYGWWGVLRASGVIFFAYIGFDAVSVAAHEAKNPQRDMPIGILGSLVICTVLYILMSLTVTGLAHYSTLGVDNPVSFAVAQAGPQIAWLEPYVNVAAVVGLGTVVLVLLYGQSRIFYAMASDNLLPQMFAAVHPTFRTPWRGTLVTGVFAGLLGGVLPLSILGELVSIGTLAAFVLVSVGIIVLRSTKPNAPRPFRTPFVPLVPILSVLVCGAMMVWLPADTWIRLAVWFFIGLVIYAVYGSRRTATPKWTLPD
ncbi:MAG: amino acid permease [Alphaproteobacteria bacterium]|nr:amino acid permease [Alphaproteobacteria bacterium]